MSKERGRFRRSKGLVRIERAQEEAHSDSPDVELAPVEDFTVDYGAERVFQRTQRSARGELVDFVLELRREGKLGYIPVVRVDNTHEVVHRHRFDERGRQVDRTEMPHLDYEEGFRWALDEVYGAVEATAGEVPR